MSKRISLVVLLCLCFLNITTVSSHAVREPDLNAEIAILIEASTGKVLFAKNADEPAYPASTTKILTLLTALENNNGRQVVMISKNAAGVEGSSSELRANETYQLSELFYGMMLSSGNDAATAIAEHISGSTDRFAFLMNMTAQNIGVTNSNFVNPSGLPDDRHYTTAKDMALIASYALKNPTFAEITSTYKHPWNRRNSSQDFELVNTNKFMAAYDGANGVKTGYTEKAKYCLVAGAKKNGVQLIAVLYRSEKSCWDDAETIMDYGFSLITPKTIYKKGETILSVPVYQGAKKADLTIDEDLVLPVTDDFSRYKVEVMPVKKMFAPVNVKQEAGFIRVLYDGKEVRKIPLYTKEEIERNSRLDVVIN